MKLTHILWVVLFGAPIVVLGQTQPMLKLQDGCVQVLEVPAINIASASSLNGSQWYAILSVYTDEAFLRNIDQPIAGKYEWKDNMISFEPAYAFAPGQIYHAVFSPKVLLNKAETGNDSRSGQIKFSFSVPADVHPPTVVKYIYPESATLPENLLRMYLYFSAPMMPGEAYHHIRLIREDGSVVEKPFLVIDQELWDAERKRFTLLFDPGRIKRNLRSNIELGTPLQEGEKYHLLIDSTWRDVHGNTLASNIRKTFSVKQAERSKVSTRHWNLSAPTAGSLGDVVISFDRPMDHAIALKSVTIIGPSGVVTGQPKMIDDTVWSFTPDQPWQDGEYVLAISPLIEDVSGNNLNNVFDLDTRYESRVNSLDPVELSFTIRDLAR